MWVLALRRAGFVSTFRTSTLLVFRIMLTCFMKRGPEASKHDRRSPSNTALVYLLCINKKSVAKEGEKLLIDRRQVWNYTFKKLSGHNALLKRGISLTSDTIIATPDLWELIMQLRRLKHDHWRVKLRWVYQFKITRWNKNRDTKADTHFRCFWRVRVPLFVVVVECCCVSACGCSSQG